MAFIKWKPGGDLAASRLADRLVERRWSPRSTAHYVAEGILMRVKFHAYTHPNTPIEGLSATDFARVCEWFHQRNPSEFRSVVLDSLRVGNELVQVGDELLQVGCKLLQASNNQLDVSPAEKWPSNVFGRNSEKRREEQTPPKAPLPGGATLLRAEWDRQRAARRLDPTPPNARTVEKALQRLLEVAGSFDTARRSISVFFALDDRWVASRGYDGKALLDRLEQVVGRAVRPSNVVVAPQISSAPDEPAADPRVAAELVDRLKQRKRI